MRFVWLLAALTVAAAEEPREASVTLGGATVRYLHSAPLDKPGPLLVALPGADATPERTRAWFERLHDAAARRGWAVAIPLAGFLSDGGAQILERIVSDARQRTHSANGGAFLLGTGPAVAEVFYVTARTPDLWSAAVASEGSPQAAINTARLYAANVQALPFLWVAPPAVTEPVQRKLRAAGFPFETAASLDEARLFEWMAAHAGEPAPPLVDCETHSPQFGRCYWVEMTKFDLKQRNDALKSSRVPAGSGASLDLGGFGYDPADPGPGVRVSWLPSGYPGPLKLGDRIVQIGGRAIASGADYLRFIDEEVRDEKAVAVTVERAKERHRIETRLALPKRELSVTARVRAQRSLDPKEVLLISRGVSELRLRLPEDWGAGTVNWNAYEFKIDGGGCWQVSAVKEPASASRCP